VVRAPLATEPISFNTALPSGVLLISCSSLQEMPSGPGGDWMEQQRKAALLADSDVVLA